MISNMKFVISRRNLPTKLPLTQSIVIAIAIDYYKAPEWFCGVVITLYVIIWIACIIDFFREKDIIVFDNNVSVNNDFKKSTFKERLDDYMKKQDNA